MIQGDHFADDGNQPGIQALMQTFSLGLTERSVLVLQRLLATNRDEDGVVLCVVEELDGVCERLQQ